MSKSVARKDARKEAYVEKLNALENILFTGVGGRGRVTSMKCPYVALYHLEIIFWRVDLFILYCWNLSIISQGFRVKEFVVIFFQTCECIYNNLLVLLIYFLTKHEKYLRKTLQYIYFKNNYRVVHVDSWICLTLVSVKIGLTQKHRELFRNKVLSTCHAHNRTVFHKITRGYSQGEFRGKPNLRDILARFLE